MTGKQRFLRVFCALLAPIVASMASAMDGYYGYSAMYNAEKPLTSTSLGAQRC